MTIETTVAALTDAFGALPFTAREAQAAGISGDRLQRAARANAITRLRQGAYCVNVDPAIAGWVLARHRVDDLRQRGTDAVIAGIAAAQIWDLPTFDDARTRPSPGHSDDARTRPGPGHSVGSRSPRAIPTILVPPSARAGTRGGVRARHALLDPRDVVTVRVPRDASSTHQDDALHALREPSHQTLTSYAVTSPIRTAIDVVRSFTSGELATYQTAAMLSIALRRHVQWREPQVASWQGDRVFFDERRTDWACEEQLGSAALLDELEDVVSRCPRRGLQAVHAAVGLLQPRSESVLEAISWARMAQAGLTLPTTQAWLSGRSGRRYRVDFWWPEYGVIGEADGALKYRDSSAVMEEKSRQAELEAEGLLVVRWTWADACGPAHFIGRLEQAFARSLRAG